MLPDCLPVFAEATQVAELLMQKAQQVPSADYLDEIYGQLPKVERSGSTSIVSLHGPISKGVSKLSQRIGVRDIDAFTEDFATAEADTETRSILIDVNSGGGSLSGIPNAAQRISNSKKPVVAYISGMAASAAYWTIAGASKIVGPPDSAAGSIGAYMTFMDISKALENFGIKFEVIKNKAGKFKAAGMPGTSLSTDQKAQMQEFVEDSFALFEGHVKASRPFVPTEARQGQLFTAARAKKMNLIDAIGFSETAIKFAESHETKVSRTTQS